MVWHVAPFLLRRANKRHDDDLLKAVANSWMTSGCVCLDREVYNSWMTTALCSYVIKAQ